MEAGIAPVVVPRLARIDTLKRRERELNRGFVAAGTRE
jgi:hypothetical protein